MIETITKTELKITVGRLLFEVRSEGEMRTAFREHLDIEIATVMEAHGAYRDNSVTIDARGQILPFANAAYWEWANYFGSFPVRVYAVEWVSDKSKW